MKEYLPLIPDPISTEPISGEPAGLTGEAANANRFSGDSKAKIPIGCNPLVLSYFPLVKAVAEQVLGIVPANQRLDRDDVVQAGLAGLKAAARLYGPGTSVAFPLFAQHRIRAEMLDTLRRLALLSCHIRRKARRTEGSARPVRQAGSGLSLSRTPGRGPAPYGARMGSPTEVAQAMPKVSERFRRIIAIYYSYGTTLRKLTRILNLQGSRVPQVHRSTLNTTARTHRASGVRKGRTS